MDTVGGCQINAVARVLAMSVCGGSFMRLGKGVPDPSPALPIVANMTVHLGSLLNLDMA